MRTEITEILSDQFYNDQWQKQTDELDKLTGFIYRTNYSEIVARLKTIWNYALHRRLNVITHDECINEFLNNGAKACEMYDKEKDFTLYGVAYDLKLTSFPKKIKNFNPNSREDRDRVIRWLYQNQSRNGRFHLANRLFITVTSEKDKQNIEKISKKIHSFIEYYKSHPMNKVEFEIDGEKHIVYSDLIYI